MSVDHEVIRLAPLGGLSGLRVADEGSIDGQRPLAMRGGYNVQVVDGEWWCRPGYGYPGAGRVKFASIPWYWVVPVDVGYVLATYSHALLWDPTQGVQEAYTPTIASENITFNGTNAAVSTTNPLTVGQIILTGTSGYTTSCYLIVAVSGTAITLDRAASESVLTACRIIASFGVNPLSSTTYAGDDPARDLAGYALIDQLVTHAGNALYSGSPVTTAGKQYMIISGPGSSSPVAFRTDGGAALLTSWFRDTSTSSPSALTAGTLCANHQNRVIMQGADPTGAYSDRTVWHSMPGDFAIWHTGVAGQNAIPHFKTFESQNQADGFRAIAPLGENLIIHRKYSQIVGVPQPSATGPYRWSYLETGHGLNRARAIVQANRLHYIVTDHGLCAFDGTTLSPLQAGVEQHLRSMRMWQEVRLLLADEPRERIYGFQQNAGARTRHQAAAIPTTADVTIASGSSSQTWQNARAVYVYDYKNNVSWMEDHVTIVGGGPASAGFSVATSFYVVRFDGTILDLATDTQTTGFDQGVTSSTHTVDALIDTPWIGFESRVRVNKIVVGFRALNLTTGGSPNITDLWTLTTETLHLATVSVFAEGDMTTAVESQDYTKLVSAMKALTADENQQMPVMDIEMPFDQAAGMSLKLRIKNALSSASTTAGYTKGLFRIAYIDLHVTKPLGQDKSLIAGVPDPAP